MAIITSPLFTKYHTTFPPKKWGKVIQWSLDARRATIFFRRVRAQGKNIREGIDTKIFGTFSPDVSEHSEITPYHKLLEEGKDKLRFGEGSPNVNIHTKFIPNKQAKSLEDYVAIIDLDSKGPDNQYEVIRLPFIPRELSYNSESAFATIKPMGRNNPFYHFTGAEDRLEFEIDWHAFDWGRREVIENCRKIEALSKADAYNFGPHRVKLLWGKENVLFSDHDFIILAAPYRMTQFNKGNINADGILESTHMLPIQAYQKVTLGRITRNNLSKVDIEFVNAAAPTRVGTKLSSPSLGTLIL